MKKRFSRSFLAIPIGLMLTTSAPLLMMQRSHMPDAVTGIVMGFGIGIMLFPLILRKRRQRCASVNNAD